MTENGFCMASVSIAIRRCPALPEGVQPSPWEKGKHPRPLSQILRICQLPRKGELLTHPQGLHFIWKLRRYCKKAPPSEELANECEPERVQHAEKQTKKPIPQRRAFAESGAVNAVSLCDSICEKAIQENPQIFLNCNYKINFPLNMPRAKRRASKIVPA